MAKVMISMPDDLLERVDERARKREMSRSALLREAVQRELELPDPERRRAAIERLTADYDFETGEPFDSAAWIRHDRDTRDERHRK